MPIVGQDFHESEDVAARDTDHELDGVLENRALWRGELGAHHAFHHETQQADSLVDQRLTFGAASLHALIPDIEEVQRQIKFWRDIGRVWYVQASELLAKLGLTVDHHDTTVLFAGQVMCNDILEQVGFS
ncbi:hypothetical protein KBY24_15155 [Ruegeria pomeroyi]|nr:hypothetical protein [Ruegeria pomeroyi]